MADDNRTPLPRPSPTANVMNSTARLVEIDEQQDAVLRELDDLNARVEQTLAIFQRKLKLVAASAVLPATLLAGPVESL